MDCDALDATSFAGDIQVTESIIEVSLPHSPIITFRASATVHTLNRGAVPARTLSTADTIKRCCIACQEPHEEGR